MLIGHVQLQTIAKSSVMRMYFCISAYELLQINWERITNITHQRDTSNSIFSLYTHRKESENKKTKQNQQLSSIETHIFSYSSSAYNIWSVDRWYANVFLYGVTYFTTEIHAISISIAYVVESVYGTEQEMEGQMEERERYMINERNGKKTRGKNATAMLSLIGYTKHTNRMHVKLYFAFRNISNSKLCEFIIYIVCHAIS